MVEINEFLGQLTQERRQFFYYLFHAVHVLVALGMDIVLCKEYHFNKKQTITILSFAPASYGIMWLIKPIDARLFGDNRLVASKVIFALLLLCVIFAPKVRIKLRDACDVVVPVFIAARGVAILGCLFMGCCYGQPVAWGIYSNVLKTTVFPCQLVESVCSVLICVFLLKYAKREHYQGSGRVAAIGLVLYGGLRFIMDTLRDNKTIFGATSIDGIYAVIMVVLGLLILYFIDNPIKSKKRQ